MQVRAGRQRRFKGRTVERRFVVVDNALHPRRVAPLLREWSLDGLMPDAAPRWFVRSRLPAP
jgi:hypothetical protein